MRTVSRYCSHTVPRCLENVARAEGRCSSGARYAGASTPTKLCREGQTAAAGGSHLSQTRRQITSGMSYAGLLVLGSTLIRAACAPWLGFDCDCPAKPRESSSQLGDVFTIKEGRSGRRAGMPKANDGGGVSKTQLKGLCFRRTAGGFGPLAASARRKQRPLS